MAYPYVKLIAPPLRELDSTFAIDFPQKNKTIISAFHWHDFFNMLGLLTLTLVWKS
jgi:hypothetical protein